ncbi:MULTISPECIES: flagellar filament capping protein FliD [Brenneria]|uniref:Flagellar hook-associated protein 2 n=1 Tax=Brenneria nigrifluens DSM 30175 = ATCC 13028 TaxID=1121120 RepID=A0A2U1UUJ5_9GAMM|nr:MULTISPECIES: flagellar filament capping protein FliD [Brenneria]EHD22013.1 flagellar hook-associated 2 domain-containing protein [Brenneria sp. EniD312]PWC25345.1 flagellar filament capping protein FliD [Brenneria nigrifluens DSM 30175 = ATCC 13028]QCR05097.1 flagellar filament capping protein FliD [Brenneria nigrifluens DSM 30175 = ATCC 13028]
MASISFTGSTSGLSDILSQLTTNEQTRLTPIKTQQTLYENRSKGFDTLKTALTKLESANEALAKANSINKTTVSSTNSAFTATTTSSASSGSYNVEVKNLATAHSLLSSEFTSSTDKLGETSGGTRTLTISQPGREEPLEITLTDSQTSLEGIRDAINKADSGIGASIIKADDDSYYLAITAKETGTDAQISVSVTGDDTLNSKLNYSADTNSGALTQQTAAQNAEVVINSITVTRQSNTITDAIDGVSLTLKAQTTSGSPETLDVANDTEPMQKAIQEWVDAYNALQTTIGTLTKYTAVDSGADEQDSSNGVLLGNSTLRNIQNKLKTQISNAQNGMDISTLNELGVKQNATTGVLEVDTEKLQTALKEKSGSVTEFFIGDGKTTGFATQVNTYLDNVLDSKDGAIQVAKDGIASTLKTLQKQYDNTQVSIEATIARYKAQFTQLDTLVSQMNSTSDYLTTQLAALSNTSSS